MTRIVTPRNKWRTTPLPNVLFLQQLKKYGRSGTVIYYLHKHWKNIYDYLCRREKLANQPVQEKHWEA